ncbi:MAG: hypothetical protein GY816_14645 [Cytophagales bacterium]|nr:hypothetical protein [Cytophagales bacterium]
MSKATTGTLEDFIRKYPSMKGLDPMEKLDFNQNELDSEEVSALQEFLTDLCTDLTLYIEMFNIEENSAELYKFSVVIFSRIERMALERICLKFSTLMDPAVSCGNDNLSFKRFIRQTKSKVLDSLYQDIHGFYVGSGIKNWRNKALAHSDLETFTSKKIDLKFDKSDIENIIVKAQELVDLISDPRVSTDHRVQFPYGSDVVSLINKVRRINESES